MINLTQNLAHALLITGDPEAILQELRDDLKVLLCETPPNKPCGVCSSCQLFTSEAGHPDLMIIAPEGKLKITKIDMVREVTRFLEQSPLRGGMRIVVFTEADTLNIASQNALLKSLEEPGAKTLLVLISAKPHLLLPTIRSRCQSIQRASIQSDHQALKNALLARPFNPLLFIDSYKDVNLLDCVHTQMQVIYDMVQLDPQPALFHFYNTLIEKSELLQKKVAVNQELILFELALAWRRIIMENK